MYFTPRGKDEREQKILDFSTSQKFLELAVSGKAIDDFFHHFDIKRIAIAPYNHFGKCLVRLLQGTEVEAVCFIDKMYYKYNENDYFGIPIESYETGSCKAVDAVIVTSNFYYNDIVDTLIGNGVSLEKIIGINSILFGLERLE